MIELVKSLGSGGIGASLPIVLMFTSFTPKEDYLHHVADSQQGYIIEMIWKISEMPEGEYKRTMCKNLTSAITELCADAPANPICEDRREHLTHAGC